MYTVDALPSLVEQRQERLRALAAPRSEFLVVTALRVHVGTALIRLGTWVEGCRRDLVIGARATGSQLST